MGFPLVSFLEGGCDLRSDAIFPRRVSSSKRVCRPSVAVRAVVMRSGTVGKPSRKRYRTATLAIICGGIAAINDDPGGHRSYARWIVAYRGVFILTRSEHSEIDAAKPKF